MESREALPAHICLKIPLEESLIRLGIRGGGGWAIYHNPIWQRRCAIWSGGDFIHLQAEPAECQWGGDLMDWTPLMFWARDLGQVGPFKMCPPYFKLLCAKGGLLNSYKTRRRPCFSFLSSGPPLIARMSLIAVVIKQSNYFGCRSETWGPSAMQCHTGSICANSRTTMVFEGHRYPILCTKWLAVIHLLYSTCMTDFWVINYHRRVLESESESWYVVIGTSTVGFPLCMMWLPTAKVCLHNRLTV